MLLHLHDWTKGNNFEAKELQYHQCLGLVNQEIKSLLKTLPIQKPEDLNLVGDPDWCYLLYGTKFLYGRGKLDPSSFMNWLTEGYDDQLIDIVAMFPSSNNRDLYIYVAQFKNTEKLSDAVIQRIESGLSYLFEESEKNYRQINNARLVSKISEVRKFRSSYPNIHLTVHYVTLACTHGVDFPDQIKREKARIQEKWAKKGFASFEFGFVGPQDLVALQLGINYAVPNHELSLPLYTSGSDAIALEYQTPRTNKRAIVFTASAAELAKFVQGNETWIFEENVRVFQNIRKSSVNEKVFNTCSNSSDAEIFWLLNNGITITCEEYMYTRNPDHPEVKLLAPQIVNGCQTSMTLRDALEKGVIHSHSHIIVRVIETNSRELVEQVTFATNNQKAIRSRDLRANDPLQRILKLGFLTYGLLYETKPNEFRSKKNTEEVISNEKCGQACVAILFRKPSRALSSSKFVWDERQPSYEQIFSRTTEELLFSYALFDYCDSQKKSSKDAKLAQHEVNTAVTRYGHFHIARIMFHILYSDKVPDRDEMIKFRSQIAENDEGIRQTYEAAKTMLETILTNRKNKKGSNFSNFFNELKVNEIDIDINKQLYQSTGSN